MSTRKPKPTPKPAPKSRLERMPFFPSIAIMRQDFISMSGLYDPYGEGECDRDPEIIREAEFFWTPDATYEDFLLFCFSRQDEFSTRHDKPIPDHGGTDMLSVALRKVAAKPTFNLIRALTTFFADAGSAPYDPQQRQEWARQCGDYYARTGERMRWSERHTYDIRHFEGPGENDDGFDFPPIY